MIFIENWKSKQFIFGILCLAFILRIPGVFDGLPAVYNSTEYYLVKIVMAMGAKQSLSPNVYEGAVFTPSLYIYPMFYHYLLLSLYVIIYLVGTVFSFFQDKFDFAAKFLTEPTLFYLIPRILNVFISLATVCLFYLFLKKIFNEFIARTAAVIFTLSYYMVQSSHFSIPDSWLILFCTLAIFYSLHALQTGDTKNLIWSAIYAGLATGTKYNGGILILMLLFIIFTMRSAKNPAFIKKILITTLFFVVGFLIPNPYWLIDFPNFIKGFNLVSSQMYIALSSEQGINYIWEIGQIMRYELVIGIGMLCALPYAIVNRDPARNMLLVLFFAAFLFIGSWQKKGIDYLFPVFPALIILLSIWIHQLWIKYNHPKVRAILFTLLFVPSFFMGVYQIVLQLRADTREQATDWLISNVKNEQKICYDNSHYDLGIYDLDRYTDYGAGASQIPPKLQERLAGFRDNPLAMQIIPILAPGAQGFDETDDLFDREQVLYSRKSLQQLREEGADFFISNGWFHKKYLEAEVSAFPESMWPLINQVQETYEEEVKQFSIVKSFYPGIWTAGPELHIYILQ